MQYGFGLDWIYLVSRIIRKARYVASLIGRDGVPLGTNVSRIIMLPSRSPFHDCIENFATILCSLVADSSGKLANRHALNRATISHIKDSR